MQRCRERIWILMVLCAFAVLASGQTNPKNVPQPPTEELKKFDPFLGKYEVSGDFANLPWSGTLELRKVIKGWYVQQIIMVKGSGIDREFWTLTTWDNNRKNYPSWGFQTLPVPPSADGEVSFKGDEMITESSSVAANGSKTRNASHYRFTSKNNLEIVSFRQTADGPEVKIGTLKGKRIASQPSESMP